MTNSVVMISFSSSLGRKDRDLEEASYGLSCAAVMLI